MLGLSIYESAKMVREYLLFHYGADEDSLPYSYGPKDSLHFPERCVYETIDFKALPNKARALEIGCAVGRSSFELSRHFEKVLAIDNSNRFISLAKSLQDGERVEYPLIEEGEAVVMRFAERPQNCFSERIEFRRQSAMELPLDEGQFDVVLAANVLCRLPDPRTFLQRLHHWVKPKGQLIIISPYSWLLEYAPKNLWLIEKDKTCLKCIQECLEDHFLLQRAFDMPFLIRHHAREYQWGVSQASVWKKN